jgi:SAM-dependent methyltransferase
MGVEQNQSRQVSFGQVWKPTVVDRFGIWLSGRQIRRWVPSFQGKKVGDFGCGFHATLSRGQLARVDELWLGDVKLSPDLKQNPAVRGLEGTLPDILGNVPESHLDVLMCMSVLEHLWHPEAALKEFHRILKPGGICLINVPNWRGKFFLELFAFRFKLSPADEMDDHKSYYDPHQLWPILVKAGFRPSKIKVFKHKFWLNTFAVCRKTNFPL